MPPLPRQNNYNTKIAVVKEKIGGHMEREEYLRRLDKLKIRYLKVMDLGVGSNKAFVPVDPDAPPRYPDAVRTSDYGGGLYTKDRKHVASCRHQFCDGPCEMCERDIGVMIHGYQENTATKEYQYQSSYNEMKLS